MKKPLIVGALAGMLTFVAMNALSQYGVASMADILSAPTNYWGKTVTVKGYAKSVRFYSVNTGRGNYVDYVSLMMADTANASHQPGEWAPEVVVRMPVANFNGRPAEGAIVNVTGVLHMPTSLGEIRSN